MTLGVRKGVSTNQVKTYKKNQNLYLTFEMILSWEIQTWETDYPGLKSSLLQVWLLLCYVLVTRIKEPSEDEQGKPPLCVAHWFPWNSFYLNSLIVP